MQKHARNQRQKCLKDREVSPFQSEMHVPGNQGIRIDERFQGFGRQGKLINENGDIRGN